MVWRVCRQALRRPQDAEDAFQATFLLLIKSAGSIQSSESAAGWLYRVAYRTSVRARKRQAARREESLAVDPDAPSEEAFPDLLRKQTTGVLVEELMRLPAKYQTPLVLRYLEGQSRRAIAEATDTTLAAVQGRLARGKQLLRRRLLRRGVSLSTAMAALGLAGRGAQAAEAAPAHVVAQTTSNGVAVATGGSLAASAAVVSLYQQGVRAMFLIGLAKPAGIVASVAAVALLAMAPGAAGDQSQATTTVGALALDATVTTAIQEEPTTLRTQLEPAEEREPEAPAPGVEAKEEPPTGSLRALTLPAPERPAPGARYTESYHLDELLETLRSKTPGVSDKRLLSSLANRLRQSVLDDDDEVSVFAQRQALVVSGNEARQDEVAGLLRQLETGETADAPAVARPTGNAGPNGETQRVLAALQQPIPDGGFDFSKDTPLGEVIEYLGNKYEIDTYLDQSALEGLGLGSDEPVGISRRRGTLGQAVRQLLEPLGLVAIADNGAFTVTTAEQAASRLNVRVYSVADLLREEGLSETELMQTVEAMVEPESWAKHGGELAELTLTANGVLTVSQSHRGHEQLADLLASLRKITRASQGQQSSATPPARRTLRSPTVTAWPPDTALASLTAPDGTQFKATATPQADGSAKLNLTLADGPTSSRRRESSEASPGGAPPGGSPAEATEGTPQAGGSAEWNVEQNGFSQVYRVADILFARAESSWGGTDLMKLLEGLAKEIEEKTSATVRPLSRPQHTFLVEKNDQQRHEAIRDYLQLLRERMLDGRLNPWAPGSEHDHSFLTGHGEDLRNESVDLAAAGWRRFFANHQADAEGLFRAAIGNDPDDLSALNGLGFCLLNRGEHEEALPLFQKCVAANPEAPGPLNGLGRALEAAGDLDGAIAAWERGVAAMPKRVGAAHMALGRVYSEQEEWEKALPLLQQITAEQPENGAYADWLKAAKRALSP